MNSKISISLSTVAIAAVALVFVSGPILGNRQTFAANSYGCGGCYGGYPYYGSYGSYGNHQFHFH